MDLSIIILNEGRVFILCRKIVFLLTLVSARTNSTFSTQMVQIQSLVCVVEYFTIEISLSVFELISIL